MMSGRIEIKLVSKMFLLLLAALCSVSACGTSAGKSGTLLNVELKTDEPNLEEIGNHAVQVLRNRLNKLAVDGEVRKTLPNRFEIKIYGDADLQRIKQVLLAQSKLELRRVITPPSPQPIQSFPTKDAAIKSMGGTLPSYRKVLRLTDPSSESFGQWIIVENPAIVDGSQLRDASVYPAFGESYSIAFSLMPDGAQKFGDFTGKNINNYVAIVLNDEVRSAAYIKSQIFDQGQIDGRFTKQEAEDIALLMKSGYLPATFQIIDEKKF